MIVDVCFFGEFYHAEKIDEYSELITFMKQFNKKFYEDHNIFTQTHHIIPAFECKDLDEIETIELPVSIHFKAHYLRAREWLFTPNKEQYAIGNFTEAYCILKKFPQIRHAFSREYKESEECYQKYFKPETYEAQFGKRKAAIIKKKISLAMSNLDPLTIKKRNEKISIYASQRPKSHNESIAKAKRKSIINETTGKIYLCAEDAANDLDISISSIRRSIKYKKTMNGYRWDYLV